MSKWESVRAENIVRDGESGIYYLRAKVAGKIIRRSLRTKELRIAKMKRDEMLIELRAKAGKTRGTATTLEEGLAHALAFYEAVPSYQRKPASLRYRVELMNVLRRTLPRSLPATWTKSEMQAWWTLPAMTAYSAGRRNNVLGTLRKMIEILCDRGVLQKDPTSGLAKARVTQKPLKLPSREEFAKLVENMEKSGHRFSLESSRFVRFLAYSGLRLAEAQAVTWDDISETEIRVRGGAHGTKNSEVRRVPIVASMAELLDEMRADSCDGELFSISSPYCGMQAACDRIGIQRLRNHDLRHLFATTCIESGVDVPTVSRWLGHKDGGVLALKTYGHLRDEHSQREAGKVRFSVSQREEQ